MLLKWCITNNDSTGVNGSYNLIIKMINISSESITIRLNLVFAQPLQMENY